MAIPKKVQALLDSMTDEVRRAFLASIADVKSSAKMSLITAAIEDGDTGRVLSLLSLDEGMFAPLDDALRAAYLQGGRDAVAAIASSISRATEITVRFSGRNERAERFLLQQSSRLVREIADSTRDAVRLILMQGLADGRHPRSVALDIVGRGSPRSGGVVGLNRQLSEYVSRARRELTQGDGDGLRRYLARQLRDRRYDASVRAAIKAGRGLRTSQVDRMVSAYSDRLLRFRGENIARTEATRSLNAARHEAVAQTVDVGAIEEQDVVRKWRSAGDDRMRDTHADMDGNTVEGLQAPFVTSSGARLMHPGDTSLGAPAEEVINCRCYEEVRIDYVAAQARREREAA